MKMADQPLSYWITVARTGFENDFHRLFDELGIPRAELAQRVGASPAYVSKVLNGTRGNFQLGTMAKWARAIGAIVQIRVIKEGREAVRVVDYETAAALDDKRAGVLAQTAATHEPEAQALTRATAAAMPVAGTLSAPTNVATVPSPAARPASSSPRGPSRPSRRRASRAPRRRGSS